MKLIWSLALASMLATGTAQAALMGSTTSQTSDTTQAGLGIGDWVETVTLRQFDQRLGTLTGVTFTLSGDVVASFTATSRQNGPQTVTNNLLASLDFLLPTLPGERLSFSKTSSYELAGGDTQTRTLDDSENIDLPVTGNWAAFMGLGTFDVTVEATSQSGGTAGGRVRDLTLPTITAGVGVRYDFTANQVPEPGSLALVALGLAASLLTARRRLG